MNDLIDRQAALDIFKPWLDVKGYSEGELNMLRAVIYELETMPSTSAWVSVKDKLPEKHGWYLTAHKKTYPTDSGVKICFFCHGYFTTDKEVTHWRPLPKYPESEDDAE